MSSRDYGEHSHWPWVVGGTSQILDRSLIWSSRARPGDPKKKAPGTNPGTRRRRNPGQVTERPFSLSTREGPTTHPVQRRLQAVLQWCGVLKLEFLAGPRYVETAPQDLPRTSWPHLRLKRPRIDFRSGSNSRDQLTHADLRTGADIEGRMRQRLGACRR